MTAHVKFAHGLISYPAPLSDEDRERYELTLIPTAAEVEVEVQRIAADAREHGWDQSYAPEDMRNIFGDSFYGIYVDRDDIARRIHALLPAASSSAGLSRDDEEDKDRLPNDAWQSSDCVDSAE
jgi:hypothetical protein